MSKDILHVVPQGDGWGVKREGNERLSSTHGTQKEAIDSARTLAHEGDDIVIHRPDGTIRERTTYVATAGNGNAAGREVQPRDLISVGSRVSWPAIVAGLAVTVTVFVALSLLALAIGVSTVDYVHSRTFAIGAAIVGIFSLLAALFAGGFVTSRLTTRETVGEAVVYGVLLWAGLFFVSMVTGLNLGGSFGLMPRVAGGESFQAARVEKAAAPAQPSREHVLAPGEELLSEMSSVTLAWWAFGGMALSVLAAIGGAIMGAGPGLVFRRQVVDQPQGRLAT